ncbi:ribonuclease H-like protein [Wolfiporia cocos MD-104 SS10]|uniref:Ribonuclease H-like protein n=1 Tax=Wolfiporia cocos (strain MD-104) TaxID=742152 RepID=A0A2H3J4V9_WOLCO|nr:ribonuclease H-like protein [Wolfiporia cocos MD-104 SS10]
MHIPGKINGRADGLSRQGGHNDDNKSHLEGQTILKDYLFTKDSTERLRSSFYTLTHRITNKEVKERVKVEATLYDKEAVEGSVEMAEDSLCYRRGKLIIPRDEELIRKIISSFHDTVSAGHPGTENMYMAIHRSYWWPKMCNDIQQYVKACIKCQRAKPDCSKRAAPLNPNPTPAHNWENISINMITGLPTSKGQDAIIVVVDMKSKDYIAVPTTTKLTSEGWVNIFVDKIYAQHGLPKKVFSDRGPQFVSEFIKDIYHRLGIEGNPSTAFHPQTDGQMEHMNQELEVYLRLFINDTHTNWPDLLPLVAFAYKCHVHSSTGYSPFYLTHGYHPFTGVEASELEEGVGTTKDWVEHMHTISQTASKNLERAKLQMKEYYDRKRTDPKSYEPGDMVWVDGRNINMGNPTKKLDSKRYGPYKVMKKVGHGTYELDLPADMRGIYPVFNEVLLLPYTLPAFPNQNHNKRTESNDTRRPLQILESREVTQTKLCTHL